MDIIQIKLHDVSNFGGYMTLVFGQQTGRQEIGSENNILLRPIKEPF